MEFSEKQVVPELGMTTPRPELTNTRRLLALCPSLTAVVPYDPPIVHSLFEQMHEEQIITIWPAPLSMMSRCYSPYLARDVRQFKGYLNKFEPAGLQPGQEPEVVLEIKVTEPCQPSPSSDPG